MILPLGKTRSRLAFDVPNFVLGTPTGVDMVPNARAKGRGRTKLGGNRPKYNPASP